MSEQQQLKKREGRQRLLAVALVGLVAAMAGLAFASVPLYRLFCQATGYGGVPQRADRGADKVLDRTIRIRFDANVDGALPWSFVPDQRFIDVKIGETALFFFFFFFFFFGSPILTSMKRWSGTKLQKQAPSTLASKQIRMVGVKHFVGAAIGACGTPP